MHDHNVIASYAFLILGAGPTGLGAARQLHKSGCTDWAILEASSQPGGLASSFTDREGFTWDIGGHVQFSHYDYFDAAMTEFLGSDNWLHHERESWIWIRDRFVPYPFQNNIHRLPKSDLEKCLQGLVEITRWPRGRASNFREWIDSHFGDGIAETFLVPYNLKVWAHPLETLSADWVGDRVAVTDLGRVLSNLVNDRDDVNWGPNNKFQFPQRGGTGAIWRSCAAQLPADKLLFSCAVENIDHCRHEVRTSDHRVIQYHTLISTIPLRQLIKLSRQNHLQPLANKGLLYSTSNIIGLGLSGRPSPELAKKCWIYFPESNCPFYRVTVFSNYSPYNVPDITRNWSLMCEVSESVHKSIDQDTLVEAVINGALNTRLIGNRSEIVSTWLYRASYGYPTPALHRDEALAEIIPSFEKHGVYSRGRFGLWKYEVSNQDHSFMQGVELVEYLLNGRKEITAFDPNSANAKKHPWPYECWQVRNMHLPRERV